MRVSRPSVREALIALEVEGVVDVRAAPGAGELVVELPGVDEVDDPSHLLRRHRQRRDVLAALVGVPCELAQPPLPGRLVRRPRRDGRLDQVHRSGVDQRLQLSCVLLSRKKLMGLQQIG